MGRKKVDLKIRLLIENCLRSYERSLFLILGQKAVDQVAVLNHIFCQARCEIEIKKPSILWCFKKDNRLRFSSQKTQRKLKKGNDSLGEEDCLKYFIASSNIRFCHYSDVTSVLGQTHDVLVIQDFEALTPNLLACIIECIQGGGMIIIILPSIQTLEQIPLLKMDAHSRYITEACSDVQPVFNHRFLMSLATCKNCIILNDCLKILFCQTNTESIKHSYPLIKKDDKSKLKADAIDALENISSLCCTTDQSAALKTFINALKEKCKKSVICLTSARGRGKSATLGLAISSALYLKYSHIFVTSPQLENVQTLFSFIIKGMNSVDYKEGKDYSILFTNKEENVKLISEINIFRDYKQVVKYLPPTESSKLGISEFIVIDEAAAIPLPVVKMWLKSSLVFMASTINGYEGTGRSLSLKLMSQLREQSLKENNPKNFLLHEISLNKAIRYADEDAVEIWLNKLFCLESEVTYLTNDPPEPKLCQLYFVDKKVLFSYQNVAEKFLQQLVALFVSSHYKNSPNDLFMLADAPSHQIFCLLPPVDKNAHLLPNVLCAIQVAFEGKLSKDNVIEEFSHGRKATGDMIPWLISQQYQDNDFPALSGARIVRIATHPYYQRMGYGQHALTLLSSHFEKKSEDFQSKNINIEEPILLLSLEELEYRHVDYIGVSYGLTLELLRFWKKLSFVPLYIRQTQNETTGEHSCVMIKNFNRKKTLQLSEYLCDFLKRFEILLTSSFQNISTPLALEILQFKRQCSKNNQKDMIAQHILTTCSIKRLEAYCNHLVDYHLILDLIPLFAKYYFLGYFKTYFLSTIQEIILLSIGLQNKNVERISTEMEIEIKKTMGLFMIVVKKLLQHISDLQNNLEEYGYNNKMVLNFQSPIQKRGKDNSCNGKHKKQKHDEMES